MILVIAYDNEDKFICSMNFKTMYDFDSFNENISFEEPLYFEVINFEDEEITVQ